jgi:hypothetical protein
VLGGPGRFFEKGVPACCAGAGHEFAGRGGHLGGIPIRWSRPLCRNGCPQAR